MQRREFNQTVAATLLASSGLGTLAHAQGGPMAGTDYYKLDKPAPVDTPAGKIELIEFF